RRTLEGGHLAQEYLLDRKVTASHNVPPCAEGLLKFPPREVAARGQVFLDNVQSFPQMERAGFPVQSDSAKVVQAIGQVGILLDLEQNQSRAKRMHRAGGNKEGP